MVTEVNEPVQQPEPATIVATHLLQSPTALPSPSSVPTRLPTATLTLLPTITDTPKTIPAPVTLETISTSPGSAPTLIAAIEPDPVLFSVPENAWWSEDSQVLYYQDIETQETWAYDLSTGISTSVAYVPRTLQELKSQIQIELPENASIVSVSPDHHFVLYRISLAEPILITDDPSINSTPEVSLPNYYTAELWLHKDGQDFNLGLVDNCFGLLFPPLWSRNENVAIVNGQGIDGVVCLHPVWLIDLQALTMGPLDSPWRENYKVLDLSANGDVFLVRSYRERLNYLFDSTTNERWIIPVDDTDRMMLVEAGQSLHCLVFELEYSETSVRDYVWYCDPVTGEITFLNTFEGIIFDSIISPDQKNVAFLVANDIAMGENFYKNVMPGLWLLALP